MNAFSLTTATAHEWWRLWTAHLVHWDGWHLTLNLIAFAAPAPLLESRMRKMLVLALFAAAPIVSVVILTVPGFGEYRGASGLAVGFWTAAAVVLIAGRDWLAGSLLAGLVAAKLLLEASSAILWTSDFEVLREAHLAGAVTGAVVAFALLARSRRSGRVGSNCVGPVATRDRGTKQSSTGTSPHGDRTAAGGPYAGDHILAISLAARRKAPAPYSAASSGPVLRGS